MLCLNIKPPKNFKVFMYFLRVCCPIWLLKALDFVVVVNVVVVTLPVVTGHIIHPVNFVLDVDVVLVLVNVVVVALVVIGHIIFSCGQ